jgi:hypothetical protein
VVGYLEKMLGERAFFEDVFSSTKVRKEAFAVFFFLKG